jgi:dicarboxylate transporter 10
MACASGLAGGVAGNPADVLNVRMQHDAALPPAERRNYRHAADGLARMVREEGWRALFRGVAPNSVRAVLMTASQLASYDGFKRLLLAPHNGPGAALFSSHGRRRDDDVSVHLTASFLAGFVATTVCSPVDVIKTRLMSAKTPSVVGAGGGAAGVATTAVTAAAVAAAPPPESLVRTLVGIWRRERLSWVFRGWLPSFVRLTPHTIATFLFLEQHKKLYRRWKERR